MKRHHRPWSGHAHPLPGHLDARRHGAGWLVGAHPTIAAVAICSDAARAPAGKVDLLAAPYANAFLRRVETLPGFVPFAPTRGRPQA
jgi:glutathione S-transferase